MRPTPARRDDLPPSYSKATLEGGEEDSAPPPSYQESAKLAASNRDPMDQADDDKDEGLSFFCSSSRMPRLIVSCFNKQLQVFDWHI